MKKIISSFSIFCCLFLTNSCKDTLSVKQMQEDIDFYFSTIRGNNPNLYARYSETEINNVHEELKNSCIHQMSRNNFLYELKKTSKFFDAHTRIRDTFFNKQILVDSVFPYINVSEDKMLYGKYNLLKINDVKVELLVNDLDKMVTWEMSNEGRLVQMNKNLSPLLSHIYNISSPYNCLVKDTLTGEEIAININPITKDSLNKIINPYQAHKHRAGLIEYNIFPKDSIAVFYYNSSSIYDENIKKQIDKGISTKFEEIENKQIKYLFIDVSQNTGGSDNIHRYFTKHLKRNLYEDSVRVGVAPDTAKKVNALMRELEDTTGSFGFMNHHMFSYNDFLQGLEKGYFEYVIPYPENKEGFNGQVYIIQGKNTFSAGYNFCEKAKQTQIGLLVGGIPMQRSPFCGNSAFIELPNSKFTLQYPLTIRFSKNPITNTEGFLLPDIEYPLDHPLNLEDYKKIIELSKTNKK